MVYIPQKFGVTGAKGPSGGPDGGGLPRRHACPLLTSSGKGKAATSSSNDCSFEDDGSEILMESPQVGLQVALGPWWPGPSDLALLKFNLSHAKTKGSLGALREKLKVQEAKLLVKGEALTKVLYEVKLRNPSVDLSYMGASFLGRTLAEGRELDTLRRWAELDMTREKGSKSERGIREHKFLRFCGLLRAARRCGPFGPPTPARVGLWYGCCK
uniref:Uncharacterized protein n=1 Tax=Cannabis sativa TaxID=3483 RepID=A0A803PT56_CANSA